MVFIPSFRHPPLVHGTRKHTLHGEVTKHIEPGSEVFVDALASYEGLDPDCAHKVVDHVVSYVDGHIYTNGLENCGSFLKRSIKGTSVTVQPFHLFRCLDEQTFKFNNRKDDDAGRFLTAIQSIVGRRLTYQQLFGNEGATT